MGTIEQKLNKLLQTKTAIKNAIMEQGVEVSDTDTFASYAEKILAIVTVPLVYGVPVLSSNNIELNEGSSGFFTISLDAQPTKNQVVNINTISSNITLSTNTLTFTPSNYNIAQTVTITSLEDSLETDLSATVVISTNGTTDSNVLVTIKDNDGVKVNWVTADVSELTFYNSDYRYIMGYTGTSNAVILPSSVEVDGTTYNTMLNRFKLDNTNVTHLDVNNLEIFGGDIWLPTTTNPLKVLKNLNLKGCDKFPKWGVLESIPNFTNFTGTSMENAFNGSTMISASSLVIPSTVTTINSLLANNSNLEYGCDIPEGVTSATYVYYKCTSLKEFTISSRNLAFFDNNVNGVLREVPASVKVNLYSDSLAFTTLKQFNAQFNSMYKCIDCNFKDSVNLIRVAFWGDSLTYGTTGSTVTDTYPYYVDQKLPSNSIVNNVSTGGLTMEQITNNIETYNYLTDDINVIWGGTNSTPTIEDHITQTNTAISKLQSDKYIIIGLFNKGYTEDRDAQFATTYGNKFLSIRDYFTSKGYTYTDYLLSDTVHMSEEGKRIVAQAVYEKLQSLKYINN